MRFDRRISRRSFLAAAGVSAAALALTACGGSSSTAASTAASTGASSAAGTAAGGTLNIMLETEVQSLDPQIATDGTSFEVIANYTDGLMQMDANGAAVEALAESYELSEDGKTYTVENKAGVGFINAAQKGSLKIVKTSSDGKVEGFSFRVTKTGKVVQKLLPEKVSRERRKLRKLVGLARAGIMTREHVDDCFQSWKAHAEQGDCYHLICEMTVYYFKLWEENSYGIPVCSAGKAGNRAA